MGLFDTPTRHYTDIERMTFLLGALSFIFCQALAVFGMGWLWIMAGPWALVGIPVVVIGCWPVIWLLKHALVAVNETSEPDETVIPSPVAFTMTVRQPKTAELIEARMRRDAKLNGGEVNINELDPQTIEQIFGKRKKAL